MRRALAGLIAVIVIAVVVGADAAPERAGPKSLKARTALKKYDRAAEQAQAAYRKALADARKALLAELEQAKRAAFANRDEVELRALGEEIARVKLDVAAETTKPQVVVVSARESWQKAVALKKGQQVRIRAEGSWVAASNPQAQPVGPEGWTTGESRVQYLEGEVGDGAPFLVGSGTNLTAAASGTLYLRMNDTQFDDNSGAVQAKIHVVSP